MAGIPSSLAFENFDDKSLFNGKFYRKIQDPESKNFILDFDSKTAHCAFDLGSDDIETLLSERKRHFDTGQETRTRWINVWMPENQHEIIELLAGHYGFSPRLKSSMYCSPQKPVSVASRSHNTHRTPQEVFHRVPKRAKEADAISLASMDVEKNQRIASPTTSSSLMDINHYRIVDEVWHFASVDWGFKFTCIGFNSLYNTAKDFSKGDRQESDKPAGKRVWTWLILCHDSR